MSISFETESSVTNQTAGKNMSLLVSVVLATWNSESRKEKKGVSNVFRNKCWQFALQVNGERRSWWYESDWRRFPIPKWAMVETWNRFFLQHLWMNLSPNITFFHFKTKTLGPTKVPASRFYIHILISSIHKPWRNWVLLKSGQLLWANSNCLVISWQVMI